MSGERLDELQADAEYYHDNDLWLGADTRAFMLRVIQLCEAYGRARTALEAATKGNAIVAAVIEAALITPRDAVWNAECLVENYNAAIVAIYQQSQKIEALEAENARLRDVNYDLLSMRHGSLSPRVSSVVPQESE